jgi:hypothetical protein
MSELPERSLSALTAHYRSVLSGARICQLYAYLLLFELLLKPISVVLMGVVWFTSAGVALLAGSAIPDYTPLTMSFRSLSEVFYLANVWVIFWLFADMRRAYWVLALCVLGLGHSVLVSYQGAFVTEGGMQIKVEGYDLSRESELSAMLFMIGIVASHLYFLFIAWRGQRSIHELRPDEARIASELGSFKRSAATALMAMINIPRTIRYSRIPLWTGFLQAFSGVANFVNYWIVTMGFFAVCTGPVVVTVMGPTLVSFARHVWVEGVDGTAAWVGFLILVTLFLFGLFIIGIPFVVNLLGRLTLMLARRTMQRSLHDIQGDDPRPPILFLRSFLDDLVALRPRRFLFEQWLLDGTSRSMTLDYLILSEGTEYGPTVALGNPEDPAPPYGVSRGYFENSTWQEAVADLSRRASALIVVADATAGIDWEIRHIVAHRYVAKTLFLLTPEDVGTSRGEALLGQVLDACGQTRQFDDAVNRRQVIGFWTNVEGSLELLTVDVPDVYAYLMTIRLFLRTRLV